MLFKRFLRPFAYNNEISRAVNDIMIETDKISETVTTLEKDVDNTFSDVNISGTHLVFDKVSGEQKEIELPGATDEWISIATLNDIDVDKITIGTIITAVNIPTTTSTLILSNVSAFCVNKADSIIIFSLSATCYKTTTGTPYYFVAGGALYPSTKAFVFNYIDGTTRAAGEAKATSALSYAHIKY